MLGMVKANRKERKKKELLIAGNGCILLIDV
jgi:hypothetical protein